MPPPATSYSPLPGGPPTTPPRPRRVLPSLWPATLDAFNGATLALYVLGTVLLTYGAYVDPAPEFWVAYLILYVALLGFVVLLLKIGGDDHHQHHTLPR
ncbi:hypothetical protein ACP70R_025068 [Stipagrostis hirtigluma subsp. patula]